MFKNLDVFLIELGVKYADSNKIFLVSNSVDVFVPPIIPPRPRVLLLSVITHILDFNLYFLLSKASKFSPSFAPLIMISLSILSALYACKGLFRSNIT